MCTHVICYMFIYFSVSLTKSTLEFSCNPSYPRHVCILPSLPLSNVGPLVISHQGIRVVTFDTSYSNDTVWIQNNDQGVEEEVKVASNTPNTLPSPSQGNGTRGHAVGEVVFIQKCSDDDDDRSRGQGCYSDVNIHGKLSDGTDYDFILPCATFTKNSKHDSKQAPSPPPSSSSSEEETMIVDRHNMIGCELTDGWWTRALLSDDKVLLSKGEGYTVKNKICDVQKALSLLK
jgi:hypothetical protein